MAKIAVVLLPIMLLVTIFFSGCMEENSLGNTRPSVEILSPDNGAVVSKLVMISGIATDPDGDETLEWIEVKIDNGQWDTADGVTKWSYDWRTYQVDDGSYTIYARCWDGIEYSDIEQVVVTVDNPETVEYNYHKWAVFIIAANFPTDNESKLGNGGLYLAEDMVSYFVENLGYSTSNIVLLFDDGWIREDNGYGVRIETLQEKQHEYDITYGGSTRENVETTLSYVVDESNLYDDSEVFIWFFSHGYGDEDDVFGGKLGEPSGVFLWDDILFDYELGDLLSDLRVMKTCIIVDACFSGGFADRTIYDFPTFFLFRSGIPESGRVVITGASKFRSGYASTLYGPLFTLLWFEGVKTGSADGFRPGFRETGRLPNINIFKDGEVSVEEAFYYARYRLNIDQDLEDYKTMEPQINDQFPHKGFFRSMPDLILGRVN